MHRAQRVAKWLVGAFIASALVPMAVVAWAGTPVNCCYTTNACGDFSGCTKVETQGGFNCKRTCSTSNPSCTQGNGCCSYRITTCTYSDNPGPNCSSHNTSYTSYASMVPDTHCKNPDVEVGCLETHNTNCVQ
jgi:hypothetical protein